MMSHFRRQIQQLLIIYDKNLGKNKNIKNFFATDFCILSLIINHTQNICDDTLKPCQ